MQECFCVIQYELSEVFNQFESLNMICSFTILWLFFDLATLSLAGATPWSASVPQSCWSRCCVSAPCTVLLLLVLCVPCPWSCFWLTGVTKGRPQHRAMSKVQLRNKSWPRRAHTVCTHSGVSGIMRAASKDISRSTELSIIGESRPRARIFSDNYFQSTLLLFQLPASARGIGDSGVSTAQRAIVREILQRSAVDVRPADLRGSLCDLVCRVQFAHIKHTQIWCAHLDAQK